jgi:hypothetical protein
LVPFFALLPNQRFIKKMSANKTSAPLFSNLGKAPKDLLSKGFPTTNKVEVTTTAENGVNFVATAEKRQVDKAEAIVTTLQPKYHLNVYGIELNGTLDTNNQIKAELNIEDLLVPGLKTISKAQTGANQDLEVAFEYKHEKGTFTSSFLHNPSSSKTLISATATVSQQKITAGAETKYSLAPSAGGSLTSFTGALNYKAGAHDFTAYLKSDAATNSSRLYTAGAHLHYLPNKESSFASSLEYDLQNSSIRVTIGGSHKLDASTEAKAKLASNGILGIGIAKQFSPVAKATLGAEVNSFDLNSNPKFGVHFEIKA